MMEIVLPSEEYTHETAPDGRIITRCTMRQIVLHTIGLNDSGSSRHRPYTRHGRKFYRPWRNYFSTYLEDAPWDDLYMAGYADHGSVHPSQYGKETTYWLTRKGLDWLGEQLGITIYDEEG